MYSSRYSGNGPDIEVDSSFRKWIFGLAAPFLPAIYGIACIITQIAYFGGGRSGTPMKLTGTGAIACGIMILGFSLFAHFNCFWGECEDKEHIAVIGKIGTFIMAIGGFITMVCCIV